MASRTDAVAEGPLVPSGTLAMVLFLTTEVMFFTALVSALLVLRAQAPGWPPADQPRLPVGVTGLNTAVLLASGWTVQRAARAIAANGARGTSWLAATALLGGLFLAVQGTEWARLIGFGLTTRSSLYGATFYTLVGAHAVHVVAALVVLVFVLLRTLRGAYTPTGQGSLEACRIYWIFVVALWPVLYVLVYLV